MKEFFLPIDSNNLGAYFSSALVVPQKYLMEVITDFQSMRPEKLLLTEKKVSTNANCCVELILSSDEIANLKIETKEIYSYEGALPITRIKSVAFYSNELLQNTIGVALSAAFIPDSLIHNFQKKDFSEVQLLEVELAKNNKEIESKINVFDRYMGGFAFMRFGGENFMNYSPNYFSTLSYFNEVIEEQFINHNPEAYKEYKYAQLFNNESEQWNIVRKAIFSTTKSIKEDLAGKVAMRSNIYRLESVDSAEVYFKAVLANYGPGRQTAKTTDALFQDLLSGKIKQRELISLLFGLHNGYQQFARSYNLGKSIRHVKFKMDCQLDYYTIESIFQNVFNQTRSGHFEYLLDILPQHFEHEKTTGFYTYSILDKQIIYAKRPSTVKECVEINMKQSRLSILFDEIVKDIEKRIDLVLHKDQQDTISKRLFSMLAKPLEAYLTRFGDEIYSIAEDKIIDFEKAVRVRDHDREELSLLLKKGDSTLFDEIDADGDGFLTQDEIEAFICRIIAANQNYETQKVEIEEEDTSNEYENKAPFKIEGENEDLPEKQESIKADPDQIVTLEKQHQIIHKVLKALNEAELGRIAKDRKLVKTINQVTKDNRNDIIDQIINHFSFELEFD